MPFIDFVETIADSSPICTAVLCIRRWRRPCAYDYVRVRITETRVRYSCFRRRQRANVIHLHSSLGQYHRNNDKAWSVKCGLYDDGALASNQSVAIQAIHLDVSQFSRRTRQNARTQLDYRELDQLFTFESLVQTAPICSSIEMRVHG